MGLIDKATKQQREEYEAAYPDLHAFWAKGAPNLFKWVEWCGLLAIVRYAQIKTGLWPLLAIQILLWIFLWGYFMAFLTGYDPKWRTEKELFSKWNIVSLVVSFVCTAGLVAASIWLAGIFIGYPL